MKAHNRYRRTDMAEECCGDLDLSRGVRGIRFHEERIGTFAVSRLSVTSEEGARILGKPIGHYVTVTVGKPWLLSDTARKEAASLLADELRTLIANLCPQVECVLVAGLGNRKITSDAIGPLCIDGITVSRHIQALDPILFDELATLPLAAIAPGVIGQTGIETVELIRGAVAHVHPSLVLCIDALAARSVDRLGVTVQLSDNGIAPGSGIGNRRKAIDQATLGVPVVSLGVPTVVDSSTLVYDALQKANIEKIDGALTEVLENGTRFFVSPKDCDLITDEIAELLSRAIGLAFAEGLAF